MNDSAQVIEADWTWTGTSFQPGVQVAVDTDGRIEAVGDLRRSPTRRLTGQALLPGMVNVHSHSFQRALRGHGETFPKGAGSFWTWREAMYRLVESLDAETLYRWSRHAFEEMLSCGITTVGEFHYVRHDARCSGYALDDIILQAAQDAGIRIVLLPTYYRTGGIGKPLSGGQRRFAVESPEEYWRQVDRLATMLKSDRQSLGAVVHSVRAAGIDDLISIHQESRRRRMVFHIHVEEQRQEIADCVAAYRKTPMALMNERLEIDERFTAVHCTHTEEADARRFAQAGGNVCLCPMSEANLGDGIPNLRPFREIGATLCLGTDSNARICMTDEMRWLEYGQRLRSETRGFCTDSSGIVGRTLFDAATVGGAKSLGLPPARIEPRAHADFIVLDLAAAVLTGWTPETLLDTFIFGSGNRALAATCVDGRWHDAHGSQS